MFIFRHTMPWQFNYKCSESKHLSHCIVWTLALNLELTADGLHESFQLCHCFPNLRFTRLFKALQFFEGQPSYSYKILIVKSSKFLLKPVLSVVPREGSRWFHSREAARPSASAGKAPSELRGTPLSPSCLSPRLSWPPRKLC